MTKVSIITINLNNLKGLKATYESVVAQTYADKEWIVIDGGSTHGDREFLEQHQADIDYWVSESDKGVYNAMNKAIPHATGDYVIYMNSGDTFYNSNTLSNVFSTAPTADVIYGDWMQLFSDGHKVGISAPKTFSLDAICRSNICHQAIFTKTDIMRQSPYDEQYSVYADWAKWIELTLKKHTFEYVPYTICNFLMGGICCTSDRQEAERQMLRERELSPALLQTLTSYDRQLSDISMLTQENRQQAQDIQRLAQDIQRLAQDNSTLSQALQLAHSEQQRQQKVAEAYLSYPVFKLMFKMIRAYRKHIKKYELY